MVKKTKKPRLLIQLECTVCRINLKKRSLGISRYLTQKNRRNTPQKLGLKKFCKYCNTHTLHNEIK